MTSICQFILCLTNLRDKKISNLILNMKVENSQAVQWLGTPLQYSCLLAWKIPWTEESGRLQSIESPRVWHDRATSLSLSCIGEGNGNPLQCFCLESHRDGGAWWAAIYGVAQSRTRLKWLSSSSSQWLRTQCFQCCGQASIHPWSGN